MNTVKFKGTTPNGETVYGDLTHHADFIFIDDKRVDPDSVRQLCGFDSADEEVYEGDIVIAHGKEYPVYLRPAYGVFKNLKACTKKL